MNQKLLSIAVPCYNSQEYMRKCVDSLLPGGDRVEIIIVDDGSKDRTAAIADEYARRYPGIVRAVHQENGGHGDAVMTGLKNATGLYFKVVDSDDWLDKDAFPRVLDTLETLSAPQEQVDLMICNYMYDKVGVTHKHVVSYANALPVGETFGWDRVGHFRMGQYILMHAAIYRTQLLRDCGLTLPKHTFYVDNLYVYVPMKDVERLYYLNQTLYHYYIGREDQSVNEQVMIKRIDQQLKVNRMMLEAVDLPAIPQIRKRKYMRNYLEIITAVSSIMLVKSGTPENLEKKKALWRDMKRDNQKVYHNLRVRPMGQLLHLPGRPGRSVMLAGYKVSQKVVGFN